MPDYRGQTDAVAKVRLSSTIEQVTWARAVTTAGGKVGLHIFTRHVGNGAELEIELRDKRGKSFGKFKDVLHGNRFWADILVSPDAKEELTATVKLPKHGLSMKSPPLVINPPIQITNAKWDKKEARRGDSLKITADVSGVPDGTEGKIEIWEHDEDNAHDFITKFPVLVKNKKIEAEWEYEYYEDTDDIPTHGELQPVGKIYNPPEYFFRVKVGGVKAESGLLEFKDWIELELVRDDGSPIQNTNYLLRLADGSSRQGRLDSVGKLREDNVPPGSYTVEVPNANLIIRVPG